MNALCSYERNSVEATLATQVGELLWANSDSAGDVLAKVNLSSSSGQKTSRTSGFVAGNCSKTRTHSRSRSLASTRPSDSIRSGLKDCQHACRRAMRRIMRAQSS